MYHHTTIPCSLQALFDLYQLHRILRPATIICYRDAIASLSRAMSSVATQIDLADITTPTLLAWRSTELARCSPVSFNKHRRHIRALLNFAVREEFIATSPLAKVSTAPQGKRQPKTIPSNWFSKVRDLVKANHPRLHPVWFWSCLLSVMYFGMMRRRQIVELRWEHVHFRTNAILMASEGSKSRREWLVPLPRSVMSELRDLRDRTALQLGRLVGGNEQVFCLPLHAKGGRFQSALFTEGHLSAKLVTLSAVLGYKISAHRIRHTSATLLLAKSNNLKAVSDILGHSSIVLTADTYVHSNVASLRRVMRKMPYYTQ